MRKIGYGLIALLGCGALLVAPRPLAAAAAAAAAGPACTVGYQVTSQWATGFTVQITITNNGPAVPSWNLQYAYTGNQQLQNGWNANWSQSGENITASNASWNGSLASNGSVVIGAQFTYSATNSAPTAFILSGTACNGGGSSTTQPTVSMTVGPTTNDTAPYGSTLTLSADASAGDSGTVTSVSFYETHYCPGSEVGALKLGTVTTAPYNFQWTDVPLDYFSIAAVATTSQGVSVMSPVVKLTTTSSVYPSCPVQAYVPIVAIVTPQEGAALDSNSTVPVTALVGYGSGSGTVSSLTFTAIRNCGTSSTVNIGTVTSAPYTVQWMNPSAGHYAINTAASDSNFPNVTIASDVVEVTAGPNGLPPTCPPPPPPAPSATPTPLSTPFAVMSSPT